MGRSGAPYACGGDHLNVDCPDDLSVTGPARAVAAVLEGAAGQLVAKTGVLRTVSSGDGSQWKECYNEKTGDRSKPTLKKTHLPVLLHHRKCTPQISPWLT